MNASQDYLPGDTTSNPMLDLPDTAPALSPVSETLTATAGPSPGPAPQINPATVSQYMVAGVTFMGNTTSSTSELALVSPLSST